MSDNDSPRIFNLAGQVLDFEAKQRNRARVVTPGMRQFFEQFAAFLKLHQLGLHCGLCHLTMLQPAQAWRHWSECNGTSRSEAADTGLSVVQTATGLEVLGRPPLERVELTAGAIEWLRQFQDVGPHFQLGVHCQKCQADVCGMNADTDPIFTAACGCREFIGPNRDYREPTRVEAFYESYGKVH